MCIICREWEKGKLTNKEALRNIGELADGANDEETEHLIEIAEKILDNELPLSDTDSDLEKKWHEETHNGND